MQRRSQHFRHLLLEEITFVSEKHHTSRILVIATVDSGKNCLYSGTNFVILRKFTQLLPFSGERRCNGITTH